MKFLESIAGKIYDERDDVQNLALIGGGTAALIVYVLFDDWVVAVVASVISFALVKLISRRVYEFVKRRSAVEQDKQKDAEYFADFGDEELTVIKEFVLAGGVAISFNSQRSRAFSRNGARSLEVRDLFHAHYNEYDHLTHFSLDEVLFQKAQRVFPKSQLESERLEAKKMLEDDLPF